MSSSVTRTAFPPGPEKAAMKKLKQRMTFSDHSVSNVCAVVGSTLTLAGVELFVLYYMQSSCTVKHFAVGVVNYGPAISFVNTADL